MELTVGNRLRLLNILPQKGNIVTLKIVDEARKKLALSAEEIEKFNVEIKADRATWDEKALPVDIELDAIIEEMIRQKLELLNQEDALTIYDVELWKLYVEGKIL